MTYDAKHNRATVKLNEIDQEVFSTTNKGIIYPVENKWGKQGWTIVDLTKVHTEVFNDIITTAYHTVAPKKRLRKLQTTSFNSCRLSSLKYLFFI